jgi:hypothetical protein
MFFLKVREGGGRIVENRSGAAILNCTASSVTSEIPAAGGLAN